MWFFSASELLCLFSDVDIFTVLRVSDVCVPLLLLVRVLAWPAETAGDRAAQDEGGIAVGTAGKQWSKVVSRTTAEWNWAQDEVCNWALQLSTLTLSPRQAEKPALPTVTNSRKAEILACRSLIYCRKDEISTWKFRKKAVTNNVVSGSSKSEDPTLCELRGEEG